MTIAHQTATALPLRAARHPGTLTRGRLAIRREPGRAALRLLVLIVIAATALAATAASILAAGFLAAGHFAG